MTKILFYIDTLSGGGAEKALCSLVNHMDQTKFDITVQTREACDPQKYLEEGIHYQAVNRRKSKLGKMLFSCWFRLCAECKLVYPLYVKGDYDIEAAYLECGPTKVMASSTNQKALKLAWVHCDLEKKLGAGAGYDKLAGQYRKFDKVICVSEDVRSSFTGLFGSKPESLVIHNVIDEERILRKAASFPVERGHLPVFAVVGRLSPEKGVDRLIEACRLLKQEKYQFLVWIIGDGPDRPKLERLLSDYGLGKQIKLLGYLENPYPYMAAADALVVPSRYEGLSTAATEALILGKPIVTAPCPGMGELLGNSEYGLITEDSAPGLRDGMKKLLDDPEQMAHYARAAALRGKAFRKQRVLRETENFFITELERKQRQTS